MNSALPEPVRGKLEMLETILRGMEKVAVGFSGGVDSGTLLAVAVRALPKGRVLALTASSAAEPFGEVDLARDFARSLGVEHVVVDVDWLGIEGIATNPTDRCYRCKRELFSRFLEVVRARSAGVLLEGGNVDDLGDYRPGARALGELGVRRPMIDAGLAKAEIREIARRMGLSLAERPALACLGSRFPYGARLTEEAFRAVGKAERFLRDLGLGQLRVRVHGDVARIEVEPAAFAKALDRCDEIVVQLRALGFVHVALDLAGYRTGSMNEGMGLGKGRLPDGPR